LNVYFSQGSAATDLKGVSLSFKSSFIRDRYFLNLTVNKIQKLVHIAEVIEKLMVAYFSETRSGGNFDVFSQCSYRRWSLLDCYTVA